MSTRILDIAAALESWAPRGTAESWDNVGLHVGDPSRTVSKGLIALDMTPQVLAEAIELRAELVITHHPLFFKPVSRLTPDHPTAGLALRMAEAGIALYCIHTNLDVARDGVSFALAKQLGLANIEFLTSLENQVVKLVTFVPESHIAAVRQSLADAGAGQIGEYDSCSFSTEGIGRFRPLEGASPAVGESDGEVQQVPEVRLEVEVARWNLDAVIRSLRTNHPYEEVAYDVYPVEQSFKNAGLGAIGTLQTSVTLSDLLRVVSESLDNPALRYVGDLEAPISRVAVCGGSGSQFINRALSAGADAFVTADITYHRYFEVLDTRGQPQMALIDPGHFETERITEQILNDFLSERCSDVEWKVSSEKTSPVETYVRPS